MIDFLRAWAFILLPLPWIAWKLLPQIAAQTSLIVPEQIWKLLIGLKEDHGSSLRMRRLRLALASLGWLTLVLAFAAPLTEDQPLQRSSGRDLLLALDLSASMTVKDVVLDGRKVDRFTAVKSLAAEFIKRREGDRVGLIVFADHTYLVAPLTFDVNAVSGFLDEVVVGLPGRKTAIGDAIGLSIKTLQDQPLAARVIVLLSDGDSNAGIIVPTAAARLAVDHNIRVHTIGFHGTEAKNTTYKSLQDLAKLTGGSHHIAATTEALSRVYSELDELEPTETESEGQRVERDWVQELLVISMLSLFSLTIFDLRVGRI